MDNKGAERKKKVIFRKWNIGTQDLRDGVILGHGFVQSDGQIHEWVPLKKKKKDNNANITQSTVLSHSHIFTHLMLPTTLWGRRYSLYGLENRVVKKFAQGHKASKL